MAIVATPYYNMMMETIDTFNRCDTAAALSLSLGEFSKRLGYDYAAYIAGGTAGQPIKQDTFRTRLILSTWPKGWVDQYSQPGWNERDRVAHALRIRKSAFTWSSVKVGSHDKAAQRVMETASRDFGMRFGVCVPIQGPSGYKSGFSFSGRDADQTVNALDVMQLIGIYAANRFTPIVTSNLRERVLSPREREVLTWIALGKNSRQIGEKLKLSEETIRTFAKSAMRKLNSHSRAQAAVEAFRRGEITL